MNIKITYNWILEYLDTDADPYEIQKYLSLCGPSIERVEKTDDDYVFDIEVTSNRVDTASVFGIAQEAQAILPQFGKRAVLKQNPLEKFTFQSLQKTDDMTLHVESVDQKLCSRFAAIILKNITIHPSSEVIRKRLVMCDIKSINNVVDISNYLMLSLGQPTHVFDYDAIGGASMKLRESKKGEKLVTLDGKEIELPGGDIVIEDGTGKLIDLCGLMGGENSAVSENTHTVILFVQTYNKQKIRRTSMLTGVRTVAATYFEKGLDEGRVEPALVYGVHLLEQHAAAQISSQLYDIYPSPYIPKTIKITLKDIQSAMGVTINQKKVSDILTRLGFSVDTLKNTFIVSVPSYRKEDVSRKEDIIEEVARVYGYQNLPSNPQPTLLVKQPKDIDQLFDVQKRIKYLIKHIGLHEVMNYSMVSRELIENMGNNVKNNLSIKNTISEDIKYLRTSLISSLIKNLKDNEGKKDILRFFEIAKAYVPQQNDLPDEKWHIAIGVNTDFSDLKGIVEILFEELNIQNISIKPGNDPRFNRMVQACIFLGNVQIGTMGQLKSVYRDAFSLKQDTYYAGLDFGHILANYNLLPDYEPISQYAVIKLDLTFPVTPLESYSDIKSKAFEFSNILKKVEVIDTYGDKITARFYFSDITRNITEEEAKRELENLKGIFKTLGGDTT